MAAKSSKKLIAQFNLLLEQHPPAKFSTALRRMLLEYMYHKMRIGFDLEFDRLIWSLNDLLDLLDEAADEITSRIEIEKVEKIEDKNRYL